MFKTKRIRILALCFSCVLVATVFSACKPNEADPSSTASGDQSTLISSDSTGASDSEGSGSTGASDSGITSSSDSDVSGGSGSSEGASGNSSGSSNSSSTSKNPTSSGTGSSSSSSSASQSVLKDDVIQDMGGYSFVILSPLLPTALDTNSTLFEEQLFERIDEVEHDYNCKITILNSPYPDMENIQKYILAGKKLADLLELSPYQMVAASQMGYIDPWTKASGIDPNDARWVESYTRLGKFKNKQYGLQFYRPAEARFCVVFNKTLLEANGVDADSIYDAVRNGTWTFDKFREYSKACTVDIGNDGNTANDTFGFTGIAQYMSLGFMSANGARLVSLDSSFKASASFTSTAAKNALGFYDKLINQDRVMYTNNHFTAADPWNTVYTIDPIKKFLSGKVAFLLHESWVLNQQIKKNAGTMEYGMIPYPKGPDASGYASAAQNARLFSLTSTNKDYNKAAIIFNALARPVGGAAGLDFWDDIQADYFQKNDTESLDMYKLCLDKSTFDPGLAVDSLYNEFNSIVASSIFARTATIGSSLDSIKNKFDDAIAAMFK
ncbi:MAG: ABC transporter substrate-binding protein [Saccharofermentanales bacterium]